MKSHAWKYLEIKTTLKLFLLVTVQQVLTAVGTFSLIQAGLHLNDRAYFAGWVGGTLISFLASASLSYFIRPSELKLSFSAYHNFLNKKLLSKAGQSSLWTQANNREKFLASVGSETESYLGALIYVSMDVYSYVVSLTLGVLVLGFSIDVSFIPAFVISGLLSFFTYRLLQQNVVLKSEAEQEARTQLGGYLLQAWDNIFFNNKLSIKNYQQGFAATFKDAKEKSVESARCSEALISILTLASALPVFVVIFWIIIKEPIATGSLAALLVTIPRQLNLLTTFRSLFQAFASLIAFESKFQILDKNAELKIEDLAPRVSMSEISLGIDSTDVLQALNTMNQGRLTVRGRNGSGKSTLLLMLNMELKDSFYLPTHPQFVSENISPHESTGQKLLRHLKLIEKSEANVVLLDEWDANLDEANLHLVDKFITSLSQHKVVIEVRHRG